jgi:hypothetical protein
LNNASDAAGITTLFLWVIIVPIRIEPVGLAARCKRKSFAQCVVEGLDSKRVASDRDGVGLRALKGSLRGVGLVAAGGNGSNACKQIEKLGQLMMQRVRPLLTLAPSCLPSSSSKGVFSFFRLLVRVVFPTSFPEHPLPDVW